MKIAIQAIKTPQQQTDIAIILDADITQARPFCASEEMFDHVESCLTEKEWDWVQVHDFERNYFFVLSKENPKDFVRKEAIRKVGAEIAPLLKREQLLDFQVITKGNDELMLSFTEGLVLGSYAFTQHKTNSRDTKQLETVFLHSPTLTPAMAADLNALCEAVYVARDLVNQPFSHQSAEQLSQEIQALGEDAGFDVEVFQKDKITNLRMGGLMGVNKGSVKPPTFNILEYLPPNAVNTQPYVLVGKGVVFDTGGTNIKYVSSWMRDMKADMAGAASVVGTIYAIAKNKIPIHVVGLIPATDNQVGPNALVPGDVITMYTGKTVEIAHTDAEGRLILADALGYAKHYKPELVIDLATLTGSALRAVGRQGLVYMGKVPVKIKNDIENSGREVYERVVEFPLWDEYGEMLKSEVADLSNLGGSGEEAGAITAGKFLQNFTDYDWLHFDIAGPAYLDSPDSYRGKHGTGVGVRLLYHFLKSQTLESDRE